MTLPRRWPGGGAGGWWVIGCKGMVGDLGVVGKGMVGDWMVGQGGRPDGAGGWWVIGWGGGREAGDGE